MAETIEWAKHDARIVKLKADGKSFAEISEETGISTTSLRTRLVMLGAYQAKRSMTKPKGEKRLIQVTCFCCRRKWRTDNSMLRKCPQCRKAGHEVSCYEWRALNGMC